MKLENFQEISKPLLADKYDGRKHLMPIRTAFFFSLRDYNSKFGKSQPLMQKH